MPREADAAGRDGIAPPTGSCTVRLHHADIGFQRLPKLVSGRIIGALVYAPVEGVTGNRCWENNNLCGVPCRRATGLTDHGSGFLAALCAACHWVLGREVSFRTSKVLRCAHQHAHSHNPRTAHNCA